MMTKKKTTKKTKDISATKSTKKTVKKSTRPKKGLGDVVEVITEATGIKAVVELWEEKTGKDCGCEERKERLNNLFKNRISKPNCLTKKQYESLKELLGEIKESRKIKASQRKRIARIYSEVFGTRYTVWCSVCHEEWAGRLRDLQRVFDEYKNEADA